MERIEILDLMSELKLFGMEAAFDEVMANGVERRHEPQRIMGDLLKAEIAEKTTRSIKYQLTIAKLPLAKGLTDFEFKGTSTAGGWRNRGSGRSREASGQAGRSLDDGRTPHRCDNGHSHRAHPLVDQ